jgi:anti-anti-sigma factor
MAIDWSDHIVLAQLNDEPSLSDELGTLIDRLDVLAADESPVPHLVLDFSAVSYINSSNIAQLLRLSKLMSGASRSMRLCALSDEVWSVMMVTGLDKVFRFAPDPMTALASVQLEEPDASPSGADEDF